MSYINNLNTHNGKIGKLGEDFACDFLESKGHFILDRNYRVKLGEIDIVSKFKNKVHIVEVKTSQSLNVRAEENMNPAKMRKVAKLAEVYMSHVTHETLFCIDFVGVYLNSDFTLREIKYIENLEIN